MRQILVALDLTPHADRTFDRAVQLALQHQAQLTAIHIIGAKTAADTAALQTTEKKLRGYSAPPGLTVDRRIEVGRPGVQIAKLVCDTAAELLILGLHQQRPIADFFREPVANCVVRRCNVPMLVVAERAHGPYRRILVATDFSAYAKRALHAAVMLAPQAELNVLHVYETPFPAFIRFSAEELKEYHQTRRSQIEADIREEMDRFIEKGSNQSPTIVPLIEHRDIDAGILKSIKHHDPDVLAMGIGRRGFAALVGSRTLAFLNGPERDLLVVP